MCGIFGIISHNPLTEKQRAVMEGIGTENTQRGNRAYGLFQGDTQDLTYTLIKKIGTLPTNPLSKNKSLRTNLFLGHTLAPTSVREFSVDTIHPLEYPDFLLAHNGLLLNHKGLIGWHPPTGLVFDSQVIGEGIKFLSQENLHLGQVIGQVASQIKGQQACWLWSSKEQALYLWRVMSPLYFWSDTTQFIFSSKRVGIVSQALLEGMVYRVDPQKLHSVQIVADFPYYSPYYTGGQ